MTAYTVGEGIETWETGQWDWDLGEAAFYGTTNMIFGTFLQFRYPTRGMSTIKQSEYFTPRTFSGYTDRLGKNGVAIYKNTVGSFILSNLFSIRNEDVSSSPEQNSQNTITGFENTNNRYINFTGFNINQPIVIQKPHGYTENRDNYIYNY